MSIENAVSSFSEIFNSPPAYILDAMIRISPKEITIYEMASKTAMSKRSLDEYLPHLVGMGLISRTKLEPRNGPLKYKLNWDNPLVRQLYKAAALIGEHNNSTTRM